MKQLGILDSAFINLEQTNTPQHIGGFGIYDPSTAAGGFVRFKSVMANVEERLKTMPVFRTRLVEVPMGLDKPYWVLDEDFDVEFHLRHIALPQPGDWRQLCIQVARLHARPLNMNRPLWECYVIEGLDNIPGLPKGAFAIYTKMHHSLIDGSGSESFMSALHDLESNPAPQPTEETQPAVEEAFSPKVMNRMQMLTKALFNNTKSSFSLTKDIFKTASDLLITVNKIRNDELPAYPINAPRSRFDQPVGPHRVFDAALFSLDDLKMIRRSTSTTINDVAIAIIAGGLRSYLQHHDELNEEQSLIGTMPVNVRERLGESSDNNQVGTIMAMVHTNIEDPLERLTSIGHSLDEAKQFIDTPLANPMKIAGVFIPAFTKAVSKWFVNSEMTAKLPIGTCGVITNVMGPPFPLYSAGAKLVQYYCLGLLTPGGGLFHAVFSMDGQVSFSALADRNTMPDPEFYIQCLKNSFAELKAAVEAKDSAKPKKAVKKKATKNPAAKKAATKKTNGSAEAKPKKKPVAKKTAAIEATPPPTTDSDETGESAVH